LWFRQAHKSLSTSWNEHSCGRPMTPAPMPNVRWNRKQGVTQKIWVVLGVLHLDKFAMALRLRWPLLEWKSLTKFGWDLGTLAAPTTWTSSTLPVLSSLKMATRPYFGIGCGFMKEAHWDSKIYESLKRNKWLVFQAFHGEAWIGKFKLKNSFTMDHLANLWRFGFV
jgi:hypothetical protein